MAGKPTWSFWDYEEERNHWQEKDALENHGDSPR
jgi:hypothetical protein